MKGICRVSKHGGPVAAGLGLMKMRMKYNMRATPSSPANRFRITPTLMTNHNPEFESAGLEHLPPISGTVGAFLGRVDLNLVLKSEDASIPINNENSC